MKVLNKNCKLGYCRLHIGIRSKPFTMFPCTTRGSVLAKHIATQAQVYFATIEHKHKENKLLTLRLIFTAVALLAIKAAQSPKFFFAPNCSLPVSRCTVAIWNWVALTLAKSQTRNSPSFAGVFIIIN